MLLLEQGLIHSYIRFRFRCLLAGLLASARALFYIAAPRRWLLFDALFLLRLLQKRAAAALALMLIGTLG